jgi:hypothetical protein
MRQFSDLSRHLSLRQKAPARVGALLVLVAAAAAAYLPSTAAAATCSARTVKTPFAALGDTRQYFLAPGGSFEGGASGWSLSNAALVSGNETSYLNSTSDQTSLQLTGSATSAPFCITQDDPVLRFAARSVTTPGSSGNYSQLNVSIVVTNASGSQASFFLGAIHPQGGWFVTPPLEYGSLLSSWLFGSDGLGTATMRVAFTVAGQGGTWYVDDVFVDPFAGR